MLALIRPILTLCLMFCTCSKVFAQGDTSFENFTITDQQKLKQIYGPQFVWSGDLVEMGPLYRQILSELNGHYEQIGKRQLDILQQQNDGLSINGGLNQIGLSYRKAFVDFNIHVNRQLAPDLFDDKRWIVSDQFTIEIDASKVLSNLREKEVLSISDKNYAAFAGIRFKRVYRYSHFADSYMEGLSSHFDHLFLGFMQFQNQSYLKLEPYEYLQKQDYISLGAGALASGNVYGPLSAAVGALAHYERVATVDVQSLGPEDNKSAGEMIRISYEKGLSKSAGLSAAVQADFLNLLKLTLFSYDFTYTLKETQKVYLSFADSDLSLLSVDDKLAQAVDDLLKHRNENSDLLAPFIVSYERRKSENKQSRYSFLTFGGNKSQETELVEVAKKGVVKEFFVHNYEKVKYVQNFFSKLMATLIKSFTGLDSVIKYKSRDSKSMRMEYESEHDLIKSKKKFYLTDNTETENFALRFVYEYYVLDTLGKYSQKYKRNASHILETGTNINSQVIDYLHKDQIRGPLTISRRYQIDAQGIRYLNSLSNASVFAAIDKLCDKKPKGIFKFFRSLFAGCRRKMEKKFERYKSELWHSNYKISEFKKCKKPRFTFFSSRKKRLIYQKCLEEQTRVEANVALHNIPLWRLKDFLQYMHAQSKSKLDMYEFFGMQNIFLYGSFSARTSTGASFFTNFSEGYFQGLGVIDANLQKAQMRSPASVNSGL